MCSHGTRIKHTQACSFCALLRHSPWESVTCAIHFLLKAWFEAQVEHFHAVKRDILFCLDY